MTQPSPKPSAMPFHPSILREYDIRGVVDSTLFTHDAYAIGRAFATTVQQSVQRNNFTIALARDGRLSSPDLHKALVRGLTESGAIVLDAGVGPTPMLYFSVHHWNADAGIMITGSHNPPTHNGFKMMLGKASFYGDAIRNMGERMKAADFLNQTGTHIPREVQKDYVTHLAQTLAQAAGKLSVAWDTGNGAGGDVVAALLAATGRSQDTLINQEIDGTFPNHHPDPSVPKNLEQLRELVLRGQYDLGLAFDGDADRLGVVDNQGRMVSADHLLMFFARDVLSRRPATSIIADVKTSQTVFDDISTQGGVPLMWKTGHSHIKAKMKQIGATFGGEASGHIFFADEYFGFDDGIYAAARMIRLAAGLQGKLSDAVDALPTTFSTPEIRLDCEETKKFGIVEAIATSLKAAGAEFCDIDGVRVNTKDGWWLLRASNTQAALIARAESTTEAGLKRLSDTLETHLTTQGLKLENSAGH